MKHFSFLTIIVLFITGCTMATIEPNKNVSNGTGTHKRINTTECKDVDDWYLDGYRVGKSFSTQKKSMFEHRMTYCHFTEKTLPKLYKTNWEKGFKVGSGKK